MSLEYLLFTIISVGLSVLAGYLLTPKDTNLARDDKPTTTATRGAFIPWVLGKRRTGAVVTWAGNRIIQKEDAPGGKGSLTEEQEVDVYYEDAVHVLASNGPAYALHRIQQQGKVIFAGPITRDSHPSGTTVSAGGEGSFVIYWGQEGTDQPVNTDLGAASKIGVASRWSFFCYVYWKPKRLGPSPNWPLLDYTIETRCEFSDAILTQTSSYVQPTFTLDGPSAAILDVTNGVEGGGYFEVLFDGASAQFGPGDRLRLTGNALPDQDLNVLKVEYVEVNLGGVPPVFQTRVRVFPFGGLSGADDAGSLQLYTAADDDGLNPAHCAAELLFAPWPRGLGLDQARWNVNGAGDSLEELGLLMESEGIRSSLIAQNGETAKALLGGLLQDLGVMIPLNTETGKIDFVPIRDASGTTIPQIPLDAQTSALPEVESPHGPRPVDKLVFSFSDRANFFRDMTIAVDEDGQASYMEHQRARKVDMPSVIDFEVASRVAERRSQEEMAGGAVFKWKSGRASRELLPGQAIQLEGFEEVLRLVAVGVDPDSPDVELSAVPDFMGTRAPAFDHNQGNVGGPPPTPLPDLQFAPAEVPAYLMSPGTPVTLVVPRIRASAGIRGATIWISADNVTYYSQGTDTRHAAGGTLAAALSASSADRELDQGPAFDVLGPDIATVLDLSSDLTSWRAGRQLCLISSSAGTEICYLKAVTAIGGGQYRLDGLIRARYDTEQLAHPIGAQVYIFPNDFAFPIQDVLIQPGATIYVKTTPAGVPLSSISPIAKVIRGKGTTPMDPLNLRAQGPGKFAFVYATGEAIECSWGYRSAELPTAGAGLGGAGDIYVAPPVQGSFVLEFLTTGDVLKKQVGITSTTYTLSNADLVAAFGSEPASFKVRVRNVLGAHESSNVTITVNKV